MARGPNDRMGAMVPDVELAGRERRLGRVALTHRTLQFATHAVCDRPWRLFRQSARRKTIGERVLEAGLSGFGSVCEQRQGNINCERAGFALRWSSA
jgi:hypothetical protein